MITIDIDDKSDDNYDVLEISVVVLLEVPNLKSQHHEAVNKWFQEFIVLSWFQNIVNENNASIDTKIRH